MTGTGAGGRVILGLDPGLGTTGYGCLERLGPRRMRLLGAGVIRTRPGRADADRLVTLHDDLEAVLDRYRPDDVAVEKIYFKKNITTGIQVSQARGVLLLALGRRGLDVGEYSPVEIKSSVAGYGNAGKGQIQEMVRRILGLEEVPRPDDAADALAVALCHAFRLPARAGARP